MLKIFNCVSIIYIALLVSACVTTTESQWVKSSDDVLLWLPSSDTTKSFSWEGDIIDNVAHGNGTLSYIDKNGEKITSKVKMFYGASSMDDIVVMDDGSQYVGAIVDTSASG